MHMKMNPVVHFEMPAKDKSRVKKYYTEVFGWDMQQTGPETGEYILATTVPVDEKTQRPKEAGAINGGFYEYGDYGKTPHLVVSVDNLKEHIEKVKKSGGKIVGEIMDIPNVGKFVMTLDSEDNRIGMLQPVMP